MLDALVPWQPVWPLIALFALVALCYARGFWRCGKAGDLPAALSFGVGLVSMYVVMQTQFDYYARYMFFVHRAQHLVLHHLGPFLIALAMPSRLLAAGAPGWLLHGWRAVTGWKPVWFAYRIVQQPVVAGLLFVGLIGLWLTPVVHFGAMLDIRRYWLMNLSMAVDGLLFWWMILDPRPPGATAVTRGVGARMLVLLAIMPPQIIIGAWITFSPEVIYQVYAVCGRAWPVAPLVDQQLGGLITWIPAAMMSVLATLVLLSMYFRQIRE